MKYIVGILTICVLGIGSYLIFKPEPRPGLYEAEVREMIANYVDSSIKNLQLGADTVLPIAGVTYNLSGSGVSGSATSITLASLTLPQTGQKLIDSDFSTTFYLTLEPGNRTRQEIVSCTTVTQNASTATLSSCTRGLSPITPYTASTTLQFSHGGGSQVIFSNPPQLYNQFTAKGNDETITGTWTYTSTAQPIYDASPTFTDSLALVTKGYADGLSFNGVATSSESNFGGVWLSTALQQASSTDGSPNKPYVLQSKNATSSQSFPATVSALKVLVTDNLGFLSNMFISTTSIYRWSGLHFFTASTSLNSTTTIAATTGSLLGLNNVNYAFPLTQGASSTVLLNNGSGSLTWMNESWDLLSSTTTINAMKVATSTFSGRQHIKVVAMIPSLGGGGNNLSFRFNGDGSAIYGSSVSEDGATAVTQSNTRFSNTSSATTSAAAFFLELEFGNVTAQPKVGSIKNIITNAAGASAPTTATGGFIYNNTSAQVTSVQIAANADSAFTLGVGTVVKVYGSRD